MEDDGGLFIAEVTAIKPGHVEQFDTEEVQDAIVRRIEGERGQQMKNRYFDTIAKRLSFTDPGMMNKRSGDGDAGLSALVVGRHHAMNSEITISVNGEDRNCPLGTSISKLLETMSLKPEKVAVELNRRLVRNAQYATELKPGR